jgi:hypothetical protein
MAGRWVDLCVIPVDMAVKFKAAARQNRVVPVEDEILDSRAFHGNRLA